MRGKFITVEGIEGVGKSTNIDFLSSIIEAKGFSVLRTREPGGTPMAERIRQMLLAHDEEPLPDIAELLLFFAARALHVNNTIQPALAAGTWVVCDRFTDASRAYQGHGRGLGLERINLMANWVHKDLQPDLTLVGAACLPPRSLCRAGRQSMRPCIRPQAQNCFSWPPASVTAVTSSRIPKPNMTLPCRNS